MFCQKTIKIKELGIKNIFSLSKKQSYFFFSCFPYLEYFFSLILEQSDFLPPQIWVILKQMFIVLVEVVFFFYSN